MVVFNKTDLGRPAGGRCSARSREREDHAGADRAPARAAACSTSARRCSTRRRADFIDNPTILGDLVGPGELAVLVVPIDKEAPSGRLILPQVQAIRDLLDSDAMAWWSRSASSRSALERLNAPPKLVVTDSQAFLKVAADTPPDVPMTSFSILFARFKGDLTQVAGHAGRRATCKSGDRVLIAEACSHHPIGEDIGRVKIPRWLTQYVGGKLDFEHGAGPRLPATTSRRYNLVIHCGACTSTAARCSAASCAAARPACRSPTTAWSSPTAWASSSARWSRSRPRWRRACGAGAAEPRRRTARSR